MEIFTWQTDLGAVDVLSHIPGLDGSRLDYKTLLVRAESRDVDGTVVHVASLDDIIASKRWANRRKDHDALVELDQIRRDLDPGVDLD